jgi:hypothetical protein
MQTCRAKLQGKIGGQNCWEKLMGKIPMKNSVKTAEKIANQDSWAK